MIVQLILSGLFTSLAIAGRCPPRVTRGYIYENEERQSCYQFIVSPQLSWLSVHETCRGRGGRVANIDSPSMQSWVVGKLNAMGFHKNGIWTGLHDRHREGSFLWDNYPDEPTAPLTWSNWYPNEPNNHAGNQDCVYMRRVDGYNYRWVDVDCEGGIGRYYSYICEYKMIVDGTPAVAKLPPVDVEPDAEHSYSNSLSSRDKGVKASAILLPLLLVAVLIIIILVIYRRRRRKRMEESIRLDNPCYRQANLTGDVNNLSPDDYASCTIQQDGNVRLQINPHQQANMNIYEEDLAVFSGEHTLGVDGKKVYAEETSKLKAEREEAEFGMYGERHIYADIQEKGADFKPGSSSHHNDVSVYETPEFQPFKSCVSPTLPPRLDSQYSINLENKAPVKSADKHSFRQNPLYEELTRKNPLYEELSCESIDDNLPVLSSLDNPVYDQVNPIHYSEPRLAQYDEPRSAHYDEPRPLTISTEYNVHGSVSPNDSLTTSTTGYDRPTSLTASYPDSYEATV